MACLHICGEYCKACSSTTQQQSDVASRLLAIHETRVFQGNGALGSITAAISLLHELATQIFGAGQENGEPVLCGDGKVRQAFPILYAYVADFPEQFLCCNCCKVAAGMQGDYTVSKSQTQALAIMALNKFFKGNKKKSFKRWLLHKCPCTILD